MQDVHAHHSVFNIIFECPTDMTECDFFGCNWMNAAFITRCKYINTHLHNTSPTPFTNVLASACRCAAFMIYILPERRIPKYFHMGVSTWVEIFVCTRTVCQREHPRAFRDACIWKDDAYEHLHTRMQLMRIHLIRVHADQLYPACRRLLVALSPSTASLTALALMPSQLFPF